MFGLDKDDCIQIIEAFVFVFALMFISACAVGLAVKLIF